MLRPSSRYSFLLIEAVVPMHASNALGISRFQSCLPRGFCAVTLCLLASMATGCIGTSQQQPQNAATTAVTGDNSHGDFASDDPKAHQSALYASGPSAAITPRGAAIEDDLNGRFDRAAANDP